MTLSFVTSVFQELDRFYKQWRDTYLLYV